MGGLISLQLEQRLQRLGLARSAVSAVPADDTASGLRPSVAEIAAVILLLLVYGIALADGYSIVKIANVVGPGALTLIVGWAAFRMTQSNIYAVWTPLFWYRVAMATFLGVGTTLTSFYNADTQDLITSFYSFSPIELLKFNMVNAVFHLVVLIVAYVICQVASARKSTERGGLLAIETCNLPIKSIGLSFLGLGLTTNYLFVYPASLGILTWQIPNVLVQAGQAAYVGYFLITYWALVNKLPRWVAGMIALAMIDSIVGIFELTKFAVIFPIMMIPLAFVYHKASAKRILLSLVFLVPYYYYTSDIVYQARDIVERRGAANNALFSDTAVAIRSVLQGNGADPNAPQYQLAWVRLNYVNAGTLAINFYDSNLRGDTLRDIFVVWIPRFMYPDKPNITDIARDFTFMANGNYDSSTTPTMPSEGYWDYGWMGVILFSIMFGIVITMWSFYSTYVFERGAWHLLLVALLGMRVGVRIDGMMVPDLIGPLSAVFAIHVACQLANRFLPRLPIMQRGLA